MDVRGDANWLPEGVVSREPAEEGTGVTSSDTPSSSVADSCTCTAAPCSPAAAPRSCRELQGAFQITPLATVIK